MPELSGLGEGLSHLLQWQILAAMLGGTMIGVIIGAIPGLGAAVGMALMLPLIFFWPPEVGLVLLVALWMGDNYGGSISSILLGIPGTAGAIFTMEDGYPMAQQGRGAVALGVSLMSSAIGGLTGALVFLLIAPLVVTVAVQFQSTELFWLAILGLSLLSTASKGGLAKGLLAACIGLIAGFAGIHVITGFPRFTFGTNYLLDPIGIMVVVLGCFALAMLLPIGAQRERILKAEKIEGSMFEGMRMVFRYPLTLIRSSVIGAIIGAVPGTGITVATPLAYQQTVSSSRHPETFGKGDPEGVVAPESANNAVQGGALIPTLTLGIPGSVSSAVFLSGLIIYGIRVGPRVFTEQSTLVWSVWWGMIAAVFAFVIFGLLFNRFFAKATQAPLKYLIPIVVALVIGGAYTAHLSPLDIVATLCFGVLAYFLIRNKYPLVPLILGFILGPMIEENFFRALIVSEGSYSTFFEGVINPILVGLLLLALAMYFRGQWKAKRKEVQQRTTEEDELLS